jgi:hypothetical protein
MRSCHERKLSRDASAIERKMELFPLPQNDLPLLLSNETAGSKPPSRAMSARVAEDYDDLRPFVMRGSHR